MSEEESAARAEKIDRLAELLYRHLRQLPPRDRVQRLRAIERIAARVADEREAD